MELKITREWLASNLEADEGHDFTAGSLFERAEEQLAAQPANNPMQEAFGTLIFLWRLD